MGRSLTLIRCMVYLAVILMATGFAAHAKPATNEESVKTPYLHALDSTPLGDRMPLILIHGIDPGRGRYDNWDLYIEAFQNDPGFQHAYKVYRYHYDPYLGVDENSALLTDMLEGFVDDNHVQTMRILAHSMGGVLVRNLSGGHLLNAHVDRVLTIGTPFHGTPLTVKPWIMHQKFLLSPMRGIYRLAYRITRKRHPTFMHDYCWDNFDASLPEEVTRKRRGECRMWEPNDKTEWIIYGSFFMDNEKSQQWLASELEAPRKLVTALGACETKSAAWFGPRRRLVFAREKFAKLDLRPGYFAKHDDNNNQAYSVMSFSDGVSPISSQLWLGRFVENSKQETNDMLLSALTSCRVDKDGITRLFPGLDHRDWMSGETRYRYEDKNIGNRVTDLLHPNEPAKPAIEWVIDDLLRN